MKIKLLGYEYDSTYLTVTCDIMDKITASSSMTKLWTDENSRLYDYTLFLKGISWTAALQEMTFHLVLYISIGECRKYMIMDDVFLLTQVQRT
jgi:hypothetical protein